MSESASSHQLAVVIPAFKGEYLAKALASVARQTDQRFNLYVCDDASPADIAGIAKSALGARAYVYKRFEKNLGGVSLAKQWDRCVAESHEPWVWLFSDDDLMDDNCVEAFYKFLEHEGESADILRFSVRTVDENDKVTGLFAIDPDSESWLEFAYGHLMAWRSTLMQNLVFRRGAYDKMGGFLDLPLCWGTEFAATIDMGRDRLIRRLPGARVYWRNSSQHISSDRKLRSRKEKTRAICLFLKWLDARLRSPREVLFAGDDVAFRLAMDRFLVRAVINDGWLPALANWHLLARTRAEICGGSRLSLLKYVLLAAVNDLFAALGKGAAVSPGRGE